jgi:hypothetical protein
MTPQPTAADWAILRYCGLTPENAATIEWLNVPGCRDLTTLPALPSVIFLYVDNCPNLTALPDMPRVGHLYVRGCTGLVALPDMPRVKTLDVRDCPNLTALPDMPSVKTLYVRRSGIPYLYEDKRGYRLIYHGGKYLAGCRCFTPAEAIKHWSDPGHGHPAIAAEYVRIITQHQEALQ